MTAVTVMLSLVVGPILVIAGLNLWDKYTQK